MASCRDCLHYNMCLDKFRKSKADGFYKSCTEEEYFAHADECDFFIDKSRFIEIPCKAGQTVYCIRYDKARKPFVKPLGVLSITAYGKGGFTVFTTKEDTWGITAFATAEEAEKALQRI